MQITARLIQILPLQSGMGKNGEWKKQDIVVETQDQYPKKICISLWGDKFSSVALNMNELYTIDFDVESREYNGRWYTDVKAWRMAAQENEPTQPNNAALANNPTNPFNGSMGDESGDDLPF